MYQHYKRTRRSYNIISRICMLAFAIYSFLYLYILQPGMLAYTQHVLSEGKTVYSPFLGAIIITTTLLIIASVLTKTIQPALPCIGLIYFQPCMVLSLLTNIVSVPEDNSKSCIALYQILLILLWFVVLYFLRIQGRNTRTDGTSSVYINALTFNALSMSLIILFSGVSAKSNDAFHYETEIQRSLLSKYYNQSLKVGYRSKSSTLHLTALRAYALSKEGKLGDLLFHYPQHYKSNGLLIPLRDTTYMLFSPDLIYRNIGAYPRSKMDITKYLRRVVQLQPNNRVAADYYLCALLLDKNLCEFVNEIPKLYTLNDSLPRHYAEAILLFNRMHSSSDIEYDNTVVSADYDDYITLGTKYSDKEIRKNMLQKSFGTTYWWYYQY